MSFRKSAVPPRSWFVRRLSFPSHAEENFRDRIPGDLHELSPNSIPITHFFSFCTREWIEIMTNKIHSINLLSQSSSLTSALLYSHSSNLSHLLIIPPRSSITSRPSSISFSSSSPSSIPSSSTSSSSSASSSAFAGLLLLLRIGLSIVRRVGFVTAESVLR